MTRLAVVRQKNATFESSLSQEMSELGFHFTMVDNRFGRREIHGRIEQGGYGVVFSEDFYI